MHKRLSILSPLARALSLSIRPEDHQETSSETAPTTLSTADEVASPLMKPRKGRQQPSLSGNKLGRPAVPPPRADLAGSRRRSGGDRGRG